MAVIIFVEAKKIDANINLVFDKIRDHESWSDWSSRLIHEKDNKLEYSENHNEEGSYYSWDGHYIGAGKLTNVKFDQTEIIWYIWGKMPFFSSL